MTPEITNAARQAAEKEIENLNKPMSSQEPIGYFVQALISAQDARIAELENGHEQFKLDILDIVTGHGNVPPSLWRVEEFIRGLASPSAVPDEREEWRMLKPKEMLRQSDEYDMGDNNWKPVLLFGIPFDPAPNCRVRRRRQPEGKQ